MSNIRIFYLLLGIILLAVIGCRRESEAWRQMDMAEDVMNSQPDSALSVLNSIHADGLDSRKAKARYALLKSMALDKNMVDTTEFHVLQSAIDYYPKKGTADDRLRTCYYQGRIYQNRGQNDSAMYSFLRGREFFDQAKDTMTIANLMVAQATIQYRMYKFDDYIRNNLEAARLYGGIGLRDYEVSCLANAMDGCVISDDKARADSIFHVLENIAAETPQSTELLASYILNYLLKYGEREQVQDIVMFYASNASMDDYDKINLATAYHTLGNPKTAKLYLDSVGKESEARNSLKYYVLRTNVLEQTGDYAGALDAYKDFSATIDSVHVDMMAQDLLFTQTKYELEKSTLIELHRKDRKIWIILFISFILLTSTIYIYYQYRLSQTKRCLIEEQRQSLLKDKENLELDHKNTLLAKEIAESERDRKVLEAESLRKDKENLKLKNQQAELERNSLKQANENLKLEQRNILLTKEAAEAERDRKSLEAENLKMKVDQLEKESLRLKEVLEERKDLEEPLQEVLRTRMDALNGLLASEISKNAKYSKSYDKWKDELLLDKEKFMESTRLAIKGIYPRFMEYLESHELTESEINYLCLYAIGLRGTEVGEYIKIKRHYHISSDIRKKLGIDEHETNIGIYIRKLMKSL